MTITDLQYINRLKQAREELQHRLNLFEAGKLDLDCTYERAIVAAQHARRAIAEYNDLIAKCRPLKAHMDESIHLFVPSP